MLFDRHDNIGQNRRAARPVDREHIGETRDHDPQIGFRTVVPFALEADPITASNVDPRHCPRHGIVAGGEDDAIDLMRTMLGHNRIFGNAYNRVGANIDQRYVGAIEHRIIIGVDADAFGTDWVVGRR